MEIRSSNKNVETYTFVLDRLEVQQAVMEYLRRKENLPEVGSFNIVFGESRQNLPFCKIEHSLTAREVFAVMRRKEKL
jgi:hypothetical protein